MHRKCLPLLIATITISLFIFSTGCNVCSSKKIHCPGFNDLMVLQWFPYQQGEKITFTSANNKATLLTISEVSKSEPTDITVGGFGSNATCDPSFIVRSQETDTAYNQRLQIYSDIFYNSSGNEEGRSTQLNFYGERFDAAKVVDTGFVLSSNTPSYISTQFFNSLTLDNITFTNVQILKIDTNLIKPVNIRAVYISKNNGIVGYITYPSNELWVKQ